MMYTMNSQNQLEDLDILAYCHKHVNQCLQLISNGKKRRTVSFDERIETNNKISEGENQRGKFNRFQAQTVIKRCSKNRSSGRIE